MARKSSLVGVGDFKDFTFYPKELKPKFTKLRAPWTYMTKKEKKSLCFCPPKEVVPQEGVQEDPEAESLWSHNF
jgi:hypothetical protein